MSEELLDLTPKQERAFDALKRAVARCKKEGIVFIQVLEYIHAYNGEYVKCLDIDNYDNPVQLGDRGYTYHAVTLGSSPAADDQGMHSLRLTSKGEKLWKNTEID